MGVKSERASQSQTVQFPEARLRGPDVTVCGVVCIEWERGRFPIATGKPAADVLEKQEVGGLTHSWSEDEAMNWAVDRGNRRIKGRTRGDWLWRRTLSLARSLGLEHRHSAKFVR